MYNQRTFDSRWDLLCGEEARGPEGHVELEPLQPLEERLRGTTSYGPFERQQVTSPAREIDNGLRALKEREREQVANPVCVRERERERTGYGPFERERDNSLRAPRERDNRLRALRARERQ